MPPKVQYEKLSLHEQILLRPDTYIGSVKRTSSSDPVYTFEGDFKTGKMVKQITTISDGFLRLFIEVVSNAIDNVWRSIEEKIVPKFIFISINEKTGEFSVWNDGKNITTEFHPTEKIKIPELIFGNLLTSSNYNDSEERKTSGRNGLGSKCLFFSTKIPMWSGEIKLAKDIKIGDQLIGDDGMMRTVQNIIYGKGQMYEVEQALAEPYKVNDNHMLTLHMPDHKVIFWNTAKQGWTVLWWNHDELSINAKSFRVYKSQVECPECKEMFSGHIKRHMKRCHPGVEYVPPKRKSPTVEAPDTEEVRKARQEIEEFCNTISDDNVFDISIQDYMKLDKTTKGRLAGVRSMCVAWPKQEVELDPYVLGLWLGDGFQDGYGFAVNDNLDLETLDYLKEWGKKNDANIKKSTNCHFSFSSIENYGKKGCAPLKKLLEKYNLINNKRIPKEYLLNDRDTRLKVLAGFIDTDGTASRDGTRIVITQGLNHTDLMNDLVFLVRSLGFACSLTKKKTTWTWNGEKKEGEAWNANISGVTLEDIPTLLPRKKCASPKAHNTSKTTGQIKIKDIGEGDYVGIEIDGNQRFAINDFTVTHNCSNIFSKKFTVEIYNKEEKVIYTQKWENNMKTKSEPILNTKTKDFPKTLEDGKNGYTCIKWLPDYERFGYSSINGNPLDTEIMGQIKKIILDTALTVSFNKVQTFYNKEIVPVTKIEDYIKYYQLLPSLTSTLNSVAPSKAGSPDVSDNEDENEVAEVDEDGEMIVSSKSKPKDEFLLLSTDECKVYLCPAEDWTHISFVNGIFTKDGGVHVDGWSEAIFRPIVNKLNGNKKKDKIDIRDVRKHFCLFVFASLDKPSFDSQSKTRLNGPAVKAELKDANLKKIMKWSFVKKIEDSLKLKEMLTLKKSTERKKGGVRIEKLDDAKYAGKKPEQCWFVVCEGDSAKSYVIQGLKHGIQGKKGRDYIGVLPLKGKILNARNATPAQLAKNKEVFNLINVLGLQYGIDYSIPENRKKLRYHHFLSLCDADSVAEDTPLLLRNKEGLIEIKRIDSIILSNEWFVNSETNKEYNSTEYEVWTEQGWTKIKHVMRHKVNKKMYRVNTHTGIVDVTEDHSLIKEDGSEISPNDLKIDDMLMHSYPNFDEVTIKVDRELKKLSRSEIDELALNLGIQNITSKNKEQLIEKIKPLIKNEYINCNEDYRISVEEAWVMGFFWADGSCGVYEWEYKKKPINRPNEYIFNRVSISWAISNTNLELLETAKQTLENIYPDYDWKIIEDRHNGKRKNCAKSYKLNLNGGKKVRLFVEHYRNLFYDIDKNKIIPTDILNSSKEVREAFFNGYLYGDGNKDNKTDLKQTEIKFDVIGKVGSAGLFFLARSIGYKVSLNIRNDKQHIISFNITKGIQQRPTHRVKKIIELEHKDQYVYDLETENHHFQAGVGQLIVHNTDGLHITGLLYNFFHSLFPTVLQIPGFFNFMRVPIIKVNLGKNKVLSFFYKEEAHEYIEKNKVKGDHIRYFKGLGTANANDIKEDFGRRIVELIKDDKADKMMVNIFDKEHAEFRKKWLTAHHIRTDFPQIKDYSTEDETVTDFLNLELINFSIDDCKRSIPSLQDGLKESYRKILFAAFKRNLRYSGKSFKVAQFAGYVAEQSNYHHGEMNLFKTITAMAQRFVGSNNIPFLFNDGNFGDRLENGANAASGRYIFTKLDQFTRLIFRDEDDDYLSDRIDDGDKVEKEYYLPIIPTVLVNPTLAGIGTGWSCSIPGYNPQDCIEWIRCWLSNRETSGSAEYPKMKPWYRGFKGLIDIQNGVVTTYGVLSKVKDGVYRITEIPIGRKMYSIEKYKEKLEDLKDEGIIKEIVSDDHTEEIVDFTVKCEKQPDHKMLGLVDTISTTNMVLFDSKGKLKRYANVEEILEEYCNERYNFYTIRKNGEIKKMEHHINILQNKINFISAVVNKKLDLLNTTDDDLENYLVQNKYSQNNDSFDYLVSIQVRSMTKTKLETLRKDHSDAITQLEAYRKLTETKLWLTELKELENKL